MDLTGRTFGPTAPYDVTAEAVSAFAEATGTPRADGDPVPVTFPFVVVFEALAQLTVDPAAGFALERLVHGEQRFSYRRPVVVGDRLTAVLTVDGVRSIAGNDIVSTTSEITDDAGEVVCTAKATLIHRGAAS
jgi:hypothetical protein